MGRSTGCAAPVPARWLSPGRTLFGCALTTMGTEQAARIEGDPRPRAGVGGSMPLSRPLVRVRGALTDHAQSAHLRSHQRHRCRADRFPPRTSGGERNWDYWYCWLRDSTLTLSCLLRSGYRSEAAAWLDWLLRAVAGGPAGLQTVYGDIADPDGERDADRPTAERLDPALHCPCPTTSPRRRGHCPGRPLLIREPRRRSLGGQRGVAPEFFQHRDHHGQVPPVT